MYKIYTKKRDVPKRLTHEILRIMRLITLILIVSVMQVSAATFAQKITLNEKKASLKKLFKEIRRQSNYDFVYTDELLQNAGPVDIKVSTADLNSVLDQIFKDQPLTYTIDERTVVVREKEPAVPDRIKEAIDTPIRISGKVTDTNGMPLAGASIRLKGRDRIAVTGSDGTFSFLAQAGDEPTVSFVGFAVYHFRVSGNLSFQQIALHRQINQLNNVIVSTGYQSVATNLATGSYAKVDSALFNRRVSPDVLSRLEGIVPGLLFNRNTFNASNGVADISIRGTSTLFADNQPLIVVDGFPYDGDINNINPNTVESVSVLKDAAAASIWGVKSGNGVIVITTRHGSRNKKISVDFNSNVTIGNRPNLYYSPDFLNSNDFINVEETLYSKGFYTSTLSTPYAVVSPVVALLAEESAGTISVADANEQINALRNIDVRNDLNKYFYQHSVNQQYALDLNGGGLNSDYFISGGYDNDLSNQVGNKTSRVTLNTNYNFYPTKYLTLSAGLNYTQSMTTANSPVSNINAGGGYGIYPYAQLVGKNGAALPIVKDYAAAYTDTAGGGNFYDWKYRPLDELRDADNTIKNLDNRINLSAKYNFLDGLSAEMRYEYEYQVNTANNDYSDQTYYTRNLVNQFTLVDQYGNVTYQIPQGGILQNAVNDLTAQRGRLQLNYNKDWDQRNDLAVIAGAELNQTVTDGISQTIYGYDKNTLAYQSVDYADYFATNPTGNYAPIPNTEGLDKFTNRYISYYSNADYTYDRRYTFSLSGRIDKSNLFGVNTNQKSVPLYSTGVAWDFSKEDFYQLDWLPFGKLRVTYGYNGNVDNQVYALTTFEAIPNAQLTNLPRANIVSPGDPDLRWETTRVINFGLDYGFKGNVITGSFEYYLKKGTNLIGDSPLAPSTGFSTFRGNTADIKGNGFDLVLNANLVHGTNFRWQANFLLSHVLDKVTKYDETQDVSTYLSLGDGNAGTIYPLVNQPLYATYSYKWAGLTHNTGDPQGYLNGQVSTDYAAIINGTTTANMVYNGPSRPTTFGSLRNTFTYQRASLSFNVIYKLDYYFRRTSINYTELFEGWLGNKDFDKRWQKPGDELHTNVPSIQYPPTDVDRDVFYEYSSALIDNGDNVRLQDINISYDLIAGTSRKHLPFSHLTLYSYINNIGILWRANHNGLDPDLYTGTLPLPLTVSFGVKATF